MKLKITYALLIAVIALLTGCNTTAPMNGVNMDNPPHFN